MLGKKVYNLEGLNVMRTTLIFGRKDLNISRKDYT